MNPAQPQLRPNEAEIIERVCGGEPEAFYELVRPYERMVYATAISVAKNPADAEEIAQEDSGQSRDCRYKRFHNWFSFTIPFRLMYALFAGPFGMEFKE